MNLRYITIAMVAALFLSCNFVPQKGRNAAHLNRISSNVDTVKAAQMKLTNPTDFLQALDTLDHGNLSSLDVARIILMNCVADTLTRDSIFLIYNDFLNSVAGGYLENNEKIGTQLENSPSDETINNLKRELSPYGLLLCSSKNNFYLEPQFSFLLNNFGSSLSPAYREYLAICTKEQSEQFTDEGKILISSDSLTSRILKWESFIMQYPHFISIRMSQDQYAQYLSAFLAGMENSRVFNSENNLLNESSKASLESFILKNPGSKSAEVVKAYLEMLASTHFGYTDKVDSFLIEKVFNDDVEAETNKN